MKLDQFAIVFDNRLATFYAGQNVTGRVILQFSEKELKSEGIFLHCLGTAYVRWTERHRRKEQTVVKSYTNWETYFDFKVPLVEPGSVSQTVYQPGHHTFPFSIALPPNLPPSFEGEFGYIRYLFKCNISRPWRFDPKTKMPFTVISVADLNLMPNVREPAVSSKTKTVGILCCKSGTITANIRLSKSGFVPGEYVFFTAHVDNNSSNSITKTTVSLHSITNFFSSGGKRRTVTHQLQIIEKGAIQPFSKYDWINEPMMIPPIPPSGLGGCQIITHDYFLKFTVDPAGMFAFDLDDTLPLAIGTIPLIADFGLIRPSAPSWQTVYAPQAHPSAMPMAEPPPYGPPHLQAYPSMPPPSYQESTLGKSNIQDDDDDEHTTGQTDFAPRYAFYQYNPTAPA